MNAFANRLLAARLVIDPKFKNPEEFLSFCSELLLLLDNKDLISYAQKMDNEYGLGLVKAIKKLEKAAADLETELADLEEELEG